MAREGGGREGKGKSRAALTGAYCQQLRIRREGKTKSEYVSEGDCKGTGRARAKGSCVCQEKGRRGREGRGGGKGCAEGGID